MTVIPIPERSASQCPPTTTGGDRLWWGCNTSFNNTALPYITLLIIISYLYKTSVSTKPGETEVVRMWDFTSRNSLRKPANDKRSKNKNLNDFILGSLFSNQCNSFSLEV